MPPFFFSHMLLFSLLFAKKREILVPVYLDVVGFTPKIITRRNSRALGICYRAFFFFFHNLDKLTGIRATIWIWKVVLFQFIRNNRVRDFGIDHGKRFISFMRALRSLELFVQTNVREIFVILSKMADFGRFCPVFEIFFLMRCGVIT